MNAIRSGLDALAAVIGVLVWLLTGGVTGGRHTAGGQHRLDRLSEHQGYADVPEQLAELLEVRGRHAA